MGLTPLLLVATVASTSTSVVAAECDTTADMLQDLRTVLETDEQTVDEDAGIVEHALSPAGGPIPGDSQNGAAGFSDVDWANQFFITQIYDPRWNSSGSIRDTGSNNCGPASLAMLMAAKGASPAGLEPETAIDYARATMYPDFPAIDAAHLPEGVSLYEDEGLVLVDDDSHAVYFDLVESEPSLPQGISNAGASPVFGYSWDDLDTLVQNHGAVIAHGHITEAWVDRFPGEYGLVGAEAVPHFIAVFPASTEGHFVVSDPMHRGGAVLMSQGDLQTFFKSPINEYETAIRVVTWDDSPGPNE